ncbi:hypothetical protein C8T65DRAFT_550827, partial [Cerioporus squamosus]
GFLYYHQIPRAPPLAGQLRFRLTASADPATFSAGVDVTTRRGTPWYIALPTIARGQTFAQIRYLLTAVDRTVSQRVMDLARGHRHSRSGNVSGTRYVHSFGQPFDLTLDRGGASFTFVGKERIADTILHRLAQFRFTDSEARALSATSTGTALCCFEPSTLPQHSGKRVVLIRVLRSLEWDPIQPNPEYIGPQISESSALYPREGELLMRLHDRREPRVWERDVDRKARTRRNSAGPLAILFENASEYGSP